MMCRGKIVCALALAASIVVTSCGCNPERAMDFGSAGEIDSPPADQLSRRILREFDGRDFILGNNDRTAEVSLPQWPPGRRITIPFWLGVNPLFPQFLRPAVGHIYVISESVLVRPLDKQHYLIRAGSRLFKSDSVFEATHTRYLEAGKMLPTVVRFVGTEVITAHRDSPASGTVTEKVPILREVSLPMRTEARQPGYAKYKAEPPSVSS